MIACDIFTVIWRLDCRGDFKLLPGSSFGFPAADFLQTDADCLVINAFNLMGVDSSLPHYLLELAIGSPVFADLLIIFNEQFYRLFYAIWKAGHPLANQGLYQRLVSRFLGLHELSVLSSYVDCLMLAPSMIGLKKCLKRLLGSVPFSLIEYAEYWFNLDNVSSLGVSTHLNNCLLGRQFFTDQYAIDCVIGPVLLQESVDISLLKDFLSYFSSGVKIKVTMKYEDSLIRLGVGCLGGIYLTTIRCPREDGDPEAILTKFEN